ncbi:MAG: hypothetical protein ACI9R3_006303, partial [Verrucomicrobiales bacterium]
PRQLQEGRIDNRLVIYQRFCMSTRTQSDPKPISLAEAQRLWNLQKQNAPLSKEDKELKW